MIMENYEDLFDSICRLCLSYGNSENMVALTDNTRKDGLSCYGEAVRIFTNICVKKDSLPDKMCEKCLFILKQAVIFRKRCESSNEKLKMFERKFDVSNQGFKEELCDYVMFMSSSSSSSTVECSGSSPKKMTENSSGNTSKTPLLKKTSEEIKPTMKKLIESELPIECDHDDDVVDFEDLISNLIKEETKSEPNIEQNIDDLLTNMEKSFALKNQYSPKKMTEKISGNIFKTPLLKKTSEEIKPTMKELLDSEIPIECDHDDDVVDFEDLISNVIKEETKSEPNIKQNIDDLLTNMEKSFALKNQYSPKKMTEKSSDNTFKTPLKKTSEVIKPTMKKPVESAIPIECDRDDDFVDFEEMTENSSGNTFKTPLLKKTSEEIKPTMKKLIESEIPIECDHDDDVVDFEDLISNVIKEKTKSEPKIEQNIDDLLTNMEKSFALENEYSPKKKKILFSQKPKKQKDLQCKVCSKVLSSLSSLTSHMERHMGRRYICEHCGRDFCSKDEVLYHLVSTHDIGTWYFCKECSYKTPRKIELMVHKRIHTGERPYACDKCGLTFLRKSAWKKHLFYHKEKTIQCPQCPKKFYVKGDMLEHVNGVHHRMYKFACAYCDMTYAKPRTVRQHMIHKHGIAREELGKIKRINIANPPKEIGKSVRTRLFRITE